MARTSDRRLGPVRWSPAIIARVKGATRWLPQAAPSPGVLLALLVLASLWGRAIWLAKPEGALIFDEQY